MNITQQDDGKHGAFLAQAEGKPAGEMTYTWAGEAMFIIDHTDVDEAFKGQGVGRRLPLCPYAKSVFDKDSSIHDVLRT